MFRSIVFVTMISVLHLAHSFGVAQTKTTHGHSVTYSSGSMFGGMLYPYNSQEPWLHGYFQEIPAYGGYSSFRPYNYKQVLAQTQAAAGWGMSPTNAYSQQFWHRYENDARRERLTRPDHLRPNLEGPVQPPLIEGQSVPSPSPAPNNQLNAPEGRQNQVIPNSYPLPAGHTFRPNPANQPVNNSSFSQTRRGYPPKWNSGMYRRSR